MLYFAYGSNMLTARLFARCRSARPIGRASVEGFTVRLAKRGMDGSAKATLITAPVRCEGVLFELAAEDLDVLDRFEGVGKGYDRILLERIAWSGGVESAVVSYIASDPDESHLPFDWYLDLIHAGCREHGLPGGIADWYAAHPRRPDPESGRPGRRAALDALGRSA